AALANRKSLQKVEIRSLPKLRILHGLIRTDRDTRSYRRGFVAGFFDAAGGACGAFERHNGDSLRISQVDVSILERVRDYARSLGFEFRLELRPGQASTLRLVGRLLDRLRFFSTCLPAIRRKVDGIFGREMNLDGDAIQAIERGPAADVVDI